MSKLVANAPVSTSRDMDLSVFDTILSQTSVRDRTALLAIQSAVRSGGNGYCYLEIGSFIGGTLQPFALDEQCKKIYSIDKRPATCADDRGSRVGYGEQNTSAEMLRRLRSIAPAQVHKITCIEKDSSEISREEISEKPDICFIDGEHTTEAAHRDYLFCRSIVGDRGIICFHDTSIIFPALNQIVRDLTTERLPFFGYLLNSEIFVLELGHEPPIYKHPGVAQLLSRSEGILGILSTFQDYRSFHSKKIFRVLRALRLLR